MFHHHRNGNNNSSTMGRSRYEPVPQADEIIELSDPSYNYNTAIPNSPPPSFHSSQSTPAVSVAGADLEHERAFNNSTPRPAPSVIATGNDASSDALVVNLHHRVERLEETIGRLLLEKSERDSSAASGSGGGAKADRSNCCVSFADPSALSDSERGELLSGSNCCVTFGVRRGGGRTSESEGERQKREQEWRGIAGLAFMVLILLFLGWIGSLVWLARRPVNCNSCAPSAPWSATGQDENGSWSSSG